MAGYSTQWSGALSVESRVENRVAQSRAGLPGHWRLALGTVATVLSIWALLHFHNRGLRRLDLLAVFIEAYSVAFLLRAFAWRLLIPGGPGLGRLFSILPRCRSWRTTFFQRRLAKSPARRYWLGHRDG